MTFRLHIHVIEGNAPEAAEQLSFRERLRADSVLLEAYVARKRRVIAGGIANSYAYNLGKESASSETC